MSSNIMHLLIWGALAYVAFMAYQRMAAKKASR